MQSEARGFPCGLMRSLFRRFACASRGLIYLLTRDAGGRLHALCAVAVTGMGIALRVSALEWAVLSLATGAVIAAEGLNTAVEKLADRVTTEREEAIRLLKDVSAGAVLASAIGAAGAALAIFGPKLLALLGP